MSRFHYVWAVGATEPTTVPYTPEEEAAADAAHARPPSTPTLYGIGTLHVEDGMVSGIETATGLAFAFMVDTAVMWIFFNEAMPDLAYGWNVNSTSGSARVNDRQLDYVQVVIEGATEPYDLSIQFYRVV